MDELNLDAGETSPARADSAVKAAIRADGAEFLDGAELVSWVAFASWRNPETGEVWITARTDCPPWETEGIANHALNAGLHVHACPDNEAYADDDDDSDAG